MKARYLVVCLGLLDLTHEIYLTVKKLSKKYDISEIKVQGQYISVSSYMYEFKTAEQLRSQQNYERYMHVRCTEKFKEFANYETKKHYEEAIKAAKKNRGGKTLDEL